MDKNLCACIMGMSNVGKSSLFNYLIGDKLSIILDQEDTTVDYLTYNFENLTLIDTCGLHNVKDIVNEFSGVYFKNTDVILYVIDSRLDNYEKDRKILNFLIKEKKIWLIVNFVNEDSNKIDLPHHRLFFIKRNFAEAIMDYETINNDYNENDQSFSGINALKQALNIKTNVTTKKKLVIVGACNVGKSTLFNSLVKMRRSKVCEIAGTTRDNVVEDFHNFHLVDTAGYKNYEDIIDSKAANMRNNIISLCYGLIVVIDGSKRLTKMDKELINLINEYGSFGMIVVNKCDTFNDEMNYFLKAYEKRYPIVYASAINNRVSGIKHAIDDISKSLDDFFKHHEVNIQIINAYVKTLHVNDINNSVFNLKSLKLIKENFIAFFYNSYFEIKSYNLRTIKNFIIKQFKLFGCRIKFIHKRSNKKIK